MKGQVSLGRAEVATHALIERISVTNPLLSTIYTSSASSCCPGAWGSSLSATIWR